MRDSKPVCFKSCSEEAFTEAQTPGVNGAFPGEAGPLWERRGLGLPACFLGCSAHMEPCPPLALSLTASPLLQLQGTAGWNASPPELRAMCETNHHSGALTRGWERGAGRASMGLGPALYSGGFWIFRLGSACPSTSGGLGRRRASASGGLLLTENRSCLSATCAPAGH